MRKKGGNVLVEALTESEAFVGTVQWLAREHHAYGAQIPGTPPLLALERQFYLVRSIAYR